jgi:hypothetical protein
MSPPPEIVSLVDPFAVLNTDPAQVLLTPVLFASESAQKTMGPKFVLMVAAAELITLRFDFKIKSLPTPETVMFAPTERSPVAEVVVMATSGALIEPLVEAEPHSTISELAEIVPAEVLANSPELQVAVIEPVADTAPEIESPPAELERATVPPAVSAPPTVPKPEELRVKFRATEKAPAAVVTVDVVLVREMSWLAVIASVPVPNAPDEVSRTFVALTDLVSVIVEPEDVISASPPVEIIVAFVMLVNAPVPERVIFPDALMAPVGAIEVPPVMRTVPADAVSDPAPT